MGEENTSTRICIKNVPPSFDEIKLKSYLQSSQPSLKLTDCKLLKTKDGRSRKIAFVGFKTHDMAETAVSYFDRSFALTSRLGVSFAFSKKDGPKGDYRPWSKHSVGSSRNQKELEKEQRLRDNGKIEMDCKPKVESGAQDNVVDEEPEHIRRKREEFLSAMGVTAATSKDDKSGSVSKSKFWANDDAAPSTEHAGDIANQQNQEIGSDQNGNGSDSDDDDSSSSSSSESEQVEIVRDKDAKPKSDLDFLKSKQIKGDILSDDEDDEDEDDDNDNDNDDSSDSGSDDSSDDENTNTDPIVEVREAAAVAKPEDASTERQDVGDRLFVRNLPFTTTEEELVEVFSQVGAVSSAHIPVDDQKKNKGYGFVTFLNKRDAKVAMDRMDGEDFQGRLIHILPARTSTNQGNSEGDSMNMNAKYKDQKALARQREAESNTKSWSSSILRGDAVVDNLSDRLNMTKGDVLDVKDGISSGNAAVRIALGETHIIAENKEYFLRHGVDLTLTEKDNVKRSKTTILVKNLPFDTSLEDLTKLFHGIGGDVPLQILLPPSKTAALVQYGHANDARRAFRRLAYKKFKHIPLYLEWAPQSEETKEQSGATTGHVVKDTVDKDLKANDSTNEAADETISQSIYIKNLNFQTNEEQLKGAFLKAGFQPRCVKIPMKAAPLKKSGATGEPLSMGYGFVEFGTEEEALNAMKSLQGKLVDGHALSIKLSTKNLSSKANAPAGTSTSSKNTKIMVRNVPFEATRSELLKLFGAFGQLKKVRLPKKIDGTHRGFAFCEFLTNKEAKNAMSTLSGTHLYGRHLVLEWASTGSEDRADVREAREKAKRDALKAGIGGTSGLDKKKGRHTKF